MNSLIGSRGHVARLIITLAAALTTLAWSATPAAAVAAAETNEPPTLLVQNKGPATSAPFSLNGVALFSVTATSRGALVMHLLDHDGLIVSFLVTAMDAYTGTVATSVPAGKYQLEVLATGRWRVIITQPSSNAPVSLPIRQTGRGDAVIGPLPASSRLSLGLTHPGGGNFVIRIIDAANPGSSALINALGSFNARRRVSLTRQSWVSVEADGPWTLLASPSDL